MTAENKVMEIHIDAESGAVVDVKHVMSKKNMKQEQKQERKQQHKP